MNIPRIQIQQGYSKIGLETVRGQLSIEQPKSILNMSQQSGKLEMRSTDGELHIDQSRARSGAGLARSIEMLERISQNAKSSVVQNIGEIAQAGDRMMAIQDKGSHVFADLAYENTLKDRYMEFRGPVSYDNVDITYTPRTVEMRYTPGGVTFDPEYSKVSMNCTPSSLRAYVAQKNYINFSVIGTQLDAVI